MNINELRELADSHYRSGCLPEALDAYAMLCSQAPGDAQAWHMQAAISGMLGKYQQTADCCEKALALAPDAAAIYTNYANALVELGRNDDALAALTKALELNLTDTNTLILLGKLYLSKADHTGAAEVFNRAFKSAPENPEAASYLARLLLDSGKVDKSVSVCEQALSCNPGHNHLLLTLIECRMLSGETIKNRTTIATTITHIDNLSGYLYAIICKMHADNKYTLVIPVIQMLTGIFPEEQRFCLILADCQIKTGNNAAAIATIKNCQNVNSTYESLMLLAEAYKNNNDSDSAQACLLDASRKYPDEAAPAVLLSRIYQEKGEPVKALQQLESFLEKHPDAHQGLVEIGNVHYRAGHSDQAEQYYRQAISTLPDYAIAHNCLGLVYLSKRMDEKAHHCFEAAVRHDPKLLSAHCNLGLLHRTRGNYEQAESCYNRVLALDPEFEIAIAGKAAIYERQGDAATTLELLEPLIQSQTSDTHTLLTFSSICHKAGREREAVELLEHALNNPLTTESERMQIYFSIGKLLDRLKDYDKAFLNYELGNKLNRLAFDRSAQLRFTEATISSFSARNMKKIRRSATRDHRLVFIVGMPRSGTTLTEQILSSHPDVYGAGELSYIRDIAAGIREAIGSSQSFPLNIADITQEILDRYSSSHLQAVQSLAHGEKVIIDKMPSNFVFLGLIELLFPDAHVLHCVRDPMDTCLSCYFQQFSHGQLFSYDQSDLALYYQQYRRMMKHWKSTLSIPVMDIQYESLVQETEGVSRKMLNFIGLDWHPACAEFHRSKRIVLTASYDQVRNPVYSSSIGRWKNYQKHLSRLHEELSEFYAPGE